MLSLRPLASGVFALLGLVATLGFSRTAHALQSMTISTTKMIGTDLLVDELIVTSTGVLQVTSMAGKGMGKIHIRARKITVQAGGVITATGVGYPGANGMDGTAAMGSGGGGKHSTMPGQPGGGGGYAGAGASGANEACVVFAESAGGLGAAMPTVAAPILGSAGGAANVTSAASAGGDGGGVIILEAAEIQIDGVVEARGESPAQVSGVAPGGGSGGFISILASHVTGAGKLSVAGGAGPAGLGVAGKILPNNGGGGGGGVIFIQALDVTPEIVAALDVKGGATGTCMVALTATDGVATVKTDDPTFCVDADQDLHGSIICGGDDCNDSDKDIHPGVAEQCNDVDDNCNGDNNEGDQICPAGRTCDPVAMKCIDVSDAGADGGPPVDVGSPPDHIAFEGGCALGTGGGGLGALALSTLGLTALLGRRRRGARSTKADR